jgi:hypothetical protein
VPEVPSSPTWKEAVLVAKGHPVGPCCSMVTFPPELLSHWSGHRQGPGSFHSLVSSFPPGWGTSDSEVEPPLPRLQWGHGAKLG